MIMSDEQLRIAVMRLIQQDVGVRDPELEALEEECAGLQRGFAKGGHVDLKWLLGATRKGD